VDVDESARRPWPLWATIGFSLVISAAFFFTQIVVIVGFIIWGKVADPEINIEDLATALPYDGFCWVICSIASACVCIPLIVLFAGLREGITVREYLGLKGTPKKELFNWLGALVALAGASDFLTYALGRPIVPPFMIDVYETARLVPLLFVVVIGIAPVTEEIFFRGFLFQGIRYSRMGSGGAILITGLLWAAVHISQYDVYGVISIFAIGVLLGVARVRTGSVYVAIAMHSLANIIATVEVVVAVHLW